MNKASAFLLGLFISTGGAAFAQKGIGYSKIVPGGIPALPTITGQTFISNTVTVTWDGPSGYYQLYQLTNFGGQRQPVGRAYNLQRAATVTNPPSPVFWQVAGTTAPFAGGRACTECHAGIVSNVVHTAHVAAFTYAQFVSLGGQTNTSCWACHTVGYGAPTGYTTNSPLLAGVQCENCHGAAANHASNPFDPTAVPRVDVAGTMCGGCHNNVFVPPQVGGLHPPIYEEWSTTAHQTFGIVCAKCHDPHQPVALTNLLSATLCAQCHGPVYQQWIGSPHQTNDVTCARCHDPHALLTANLVSGKTCGECHTQTYQQWSATPHQAYNVSCAECHDPHEASVTTNLLSGVSCGACHSHTTTYQEWSATPHATVTAEVQADFMGPQGPTTYIPNCGKCHSGTVRNAYLENAPMPNGPQACAVGVACATCHDPHELHVYTNVVNGALYTNQVINPLSSLEDYHTAGNWATNYNPNINICAQCHNDRGATWRATSRTPHHSPQYNILIGTSGVLDTNTPNAAHFNAGTHALRITNQCVSCHMQTPTVGTTGHSFEVTSYNMCIGCHGSLTSVLGLIELAEISVTNRINKLRATLDEWALTQAPDVLRTNYGVKAWEYTAAGELSGGGAGPTTAQQSLIPNVVKMARYNLYLVYLDGSVGVHNGLYAVRLLDTTLSWFGVQPKSE